MMALKSSAGARPSLSDSSSGSTKGIIPATSSAIASNSSSEMPSLRMMSLIGLMPSSFAQRRHSPSEVVCPFSVFVT